jgi:arabinofuranan 3-O-arabinosyltransferase
VLALTENFNSGWKAELNGTSLRAVRVDGWRQAWAVPAGRGGNVELTFAPGGGYRLGLIVGAMAVAALVGLATVRGRLRRHAESALAAGVPPGWAAPALAGGLALVVGGPLVVLVPLAVVAHRAKPRWTAAVAGLAYAAAGAVVVWQPGRLPGSEAGAFGPLAQALTVLALVMLTLVTVRRE